MITLREFVTKLARREHFRVYSPNRDCLAYESYFVHHSSGQYKKVKGKVEYDMFANAGKNNKYCDNALKGIIDEQTEHFLDEYGDYEVFAVETGGFYPADIIKDKDGYYKIKTAKGFSEGDTLQCLDIFISPYDKYHHCDCGRCHHSILTVGKKAEFHADPKDIECRNCWRYHLNKEED